MNILLTRSFVLLLLVLVTAPAVPQRGPGRGFGRGPGGPGHRQDDRFQEDRQLFQFLLKNHERITRTVKQLENGVETLTESEDENIAAKIKEHVEWMQYRIDETQPIRLRDPLFAELFKHTDKMKMVTEETANGVRVTETSDDPYVARLIKAHAKAVSGFVQHGFGEAMKNHAVPGRSTRENVSFHPVIKKYGAVVKMPSAAQQPRDKSKICVDLTEGSEPGELNRAIKKMARFVNIYAGAGKKPTKVKIAVVIHGDATLAILNSDAYSKRFGIEGNPNLDCLHELHEAGVEIFVCGQSLMRKGGKQEDVVVFADVAVSAVTALVNFQSDGYAYVPLDKQRIPSSTTDAKTKAIAAKEALFQRLSGRLAEVMTANGPAAAISVCSQEAAEMARAVGKQHGLVIGRTAIKLRNAGNRPPAWVKPMLDHPGSTIGVTELPNGHTGVLLPIKLQAKCVACHGPAEDIADDIRRQLALFYPDDEATGFEEGDLRGWFWVDVP